MKILSIEIVGFGKWNQKTIDFSGSNQLVYGSNEAGKSTIYQFIQALLFGFPAKGKKRKSYLPKNGGSYGGRLWLKHPVYGKVQIERFKEMNKGQAKVYIGEQVGDEELLKKVLHPLTKELFQSVFTFQQEQLSQLGNLEEEELQTALLALGISGSDQLLKTREAYFKQAQEIYKSKGARPPLNSLLTAYQKLSEKIRNKEQEEQTFGSVVAQLKQTSEAIAEQRLRVSERKEQLSLVEKQLINYPLFEELQKLQKQIHPNKITVEPQESEHLLALYQEHKFLKQETERLNRTLQESFDGEELLPEYLFYLREEENLKYFLAQRYTISKLLSEIGWMRESATQNKQELFALEQKWDWTEEQPPHLFFEDQQLKELREKFITQRVQMQTEEENQRSLIESLDSQEKNLEAFESANQKIFQRNQRKRKHQTNTALLLGLLLAALMGVVGGLLLSSPVCWLSWIFALICGGTAGAVFFLPQRSTEDEVKQQWQQKLSNLDYLSAQLNQTEERMARIEKEEAQLNKYIFEQARANHLGKMNRLELWMNHKEDIKRYLLLMNTNKELFRQIETESKTAGDWLKQTERYVNWLPIVGKNLEERVKIISNFTDQMEQHRLLQESRTDSYTKQSIKEVKEKQHRVFEEAQPLLYKYQILAIDDVPEKLQDYQQTQTTDSRKKELERLLMNLYEENTTLSQLNDRKYQLNAELKGAEDEIFHLQKEEQRLDYQRKLMIEDGTLDQLYQKREGMRAEIEALASDWTGYKLAGQLLMDLLTELSDQQLPSLLKKATYYFSVVTADAYLKVQLENEQLIVKDAAGRDFAIYDLSTGTKDQLVMAVRLAFLALMGEKSICPVMIDDGWLHYDSQRKRHLAKLFRLFGENHQIICFSSDQEMVSYYQEEKQPVVQLEGE
ncbi:ATP-binding protein [Enterococcus sp. CWB-B31]|uniref:ATP-binding protein n=1 Tax=Enterococcus sp. CWB-B31 TaxID=2885159 RepID=UPI001E55611D|nr:AAA family ATPase [Enterococcus sp. CWB-B31]MCB5953695.1 AAA family ATPase [Enterococcus sp. CWB-B31]